MHTCPSDPYSSSFAPRASTPRLDARARPPARATAARARIGVAGVVVVVVRARAREDANDTADIVVVVVVIAMALGGARGRRCDDARARWAKRRDDRADRRYRV